MSFGAIEVLATIIIAIATLKIIFLSLSPQSWLKLASKMYANPKVASIVALLLAALVLYFLQRAGITILEIFAVTLLISLLMVISVAKYAKTLVEFYKKKNTKAIWKEHWMDLLAWVLLLIWGIKELIFN